MRVAPCRGQPPHLLIRYLPGGGRAPPGAADQGVGRLLVCGTVLAGGCGGRKAA